MKRFYPAACRVFNLSPRANTHGLVRFCMDGLGLRSETAESGVECEKKLTHTLYMSRIKAAFVIVCFLLAGSAWTASATLEDNHEVAQPVEQESPVVTPEAEAALGLPRQVQEQENVVLEASNSRHHYRPQCPVLRCQRQDCCSGIRAEVAKVVGKQVDCYMRLFKAESGCDWQLTQPAHNACFGDNPNTGYGLCTLEKDPALRRGRANCGDIKSIAGQVRCCQSIMRSKGGQYYGSISQTGTARSCR